MPKVMTFLRGREDGDVSAFQRWYVDEYTPTIARHPALQRWVVDIAVRSAPANPLGIGASAALPAFDIVAEAWLPDVTAFEQVFGSNGAGARLAPWISESWSYEVEENVEFDREPPVGTDRDRPPFKLVSRMRFFDDLPDSAAERSWKVHAGLACRVHVGATKYVRNWVQRPLNGDTSGTRGIVELQFPHAQAFVDGFADCERGLQEILHDGEFFVDNSDRLFVYAFDFANAAHRNALRGTDAILG